VTDEYEFELTAGRDEAAAVLRGVADGVRAGSVRVSDGAGGATADVPDGVELEGELEDEAGELSLEVELTWPTPEGEGPAFTRIETTGEEPSASATTAAAGEAASGDAAGEVASGDATTETATDAESETATDDAASDPRTSLARFELFRDRADEWRWRLRHQNGNIVATSGEGYTRKHNARKGLRSVVKNAPAAPVTEVEGE